MSSSTAFHIWSVLYWRWLVPLLVVVAARSGDSSRILSFSIYGATLFLLYLISTLYHGLPTGRAKRMFRILDHQAIYLLIAGSYTPFTLVSLDGIVGWWLFVTIWGMAVLGLVLDALPRRCARIVPVVIYLVMGWSIVLAINPLLAALPRTGFIWLLTGGIFYTSGIVFLPSIADIPGCTVYGICLCWPAASAIMWRFWSMSEHQWRFVQRSNPNHPEQ